MYYKNDLITKYAKNKVKIQFQKKIGNAENPIRWL